jgi:hypothetical protein
MTIGVYAGQPVRDYGPDWLGPPARLHGTSCGPDRIDARQQLLCHQQHIPHAHRGALAVGGVQQRCADVTSHGVCAVTSQETRDAVSHDRNADLLFAHVVPLLDMVSSASRPKQVMPSHWPLHFACPAAQLLASLCCCWLHYAWLHHTSFIMPCPSHRLQMMQR